MQNGLNDIFTRVICRQTDRQSGMINLVADFRNSPLY